MLAPAIAQAQMTEIVLHNFENWLHGVRPQSALIRDAAGNLYGTTYAGGEAGYGVVYKLDTAGRHHVLYNFTGGADGANPSSALVADAGNLYGTTQGGGLSSANCSYGAPSSNTCGVIYKLDATGHQTVLYSFTGGADGGNPSGNLVRDAAGNLYGTTNVAVFKLDASGQFSVLYTFTETVNGWYPAGVIRDSAGNLYGTTWRGGSAGYGVVYKLDRTGHETVLYNFLGANDGAMPNAGLLRDSAGNLYGTTSVGGSANQGVVFKVGVAGHETVLYSFAGGASGGGPDSGLIRDAPGNFYGTCSSPVGFVYKLTPGGQETVLYSFTNGPDGGTPVGGLIRDAVGNLYGTTFDGGMPGGGVIYKLTASGQETVLYAFSNPGGAHPNAVIRDSAGNLYGTTGSGGTSDGGVVFKWSAAGGLDVLYNFASNSGPSAGVIRDSAGNLYGTTTNGGPDNMGSVYKLDPASNYTMLYGFPGGALGCTPIAGVVRDSAGNLYGTTMGGPSGLYGLYGMVYKLDENGQETALLSFSGPPGPYQPYGGVIRDSAGNLYGTTVMGGTGGIGNPGVPCCAGVVYKLEPTGVFYELYQFTGGADGALPHAGVIRDSAGNLYGTTSAGGGPGGGCGVVYKLDTSNNLTVHHTFMNAADGCSPMSGVIRDGAGNLYGTTSSGEVYKIDTSGNFTVLYSFSGGADGGTPNGVIRDAAGNLYGTTSTGGKYGTGVIFKLKAAPAAP